MLWSPNLLTTHYSVHDLTGLTITTMVVTNTYMTNVFLMYTELCKIIILSLFTATIEVMLYALKLMHHRYLQISKILQSHMDIYWQVCYTIKTDITTLLHVVVILNNITYIHVCTL